MGVLEGNVTIVSRAARGFGRVSALLFARDGADVRLRVSGSREID